MFKPYVERSNNVVEEPKNVDVLVSETRKFSNELSSSHLSPTDTTKFKNFNVPRKLDCKLSYLEESQRQDLEKLLPEYEDLFPDVPSRTDQIYHDVDVGDAAPIKQHLYKLNPSKQQYLKEEIKYLPENDFIEPGRAVVGVLHAYFFPSQMKVNGFLQIIE